VSNAISSRIDDISGNMDTNRAEKDKICTVTDEKKKREQSLHAGRILNTDKKDIPRKYLVIANFGRKVVPDVSLFEIVRNLEGDEHRDCNGNEAPTYEKRDIITHHQLHSVRKAGAL